MKLHDDYPTPQPPSISKEKPCDIWGFGVLVLHVRSLAGTGSTLHSSHLQVYSHSVPWAEFGPKEYLEIHKRLAAGMRPPYPGSEAHERGLDFVVWRLITECWTHLPRHRPSADLLARMWNTDESTPLETLSKLSYGDIGQGDADNNTPWPDLSHEIKRPTSFTLRRHGEYLAVKGVRWMPPEIGNSDVRVDLISRPEGAPKVGLRYMLCLEMLRGTRRIL